MEYKEYLVKRKKGALEIILSILVYLVALIISLATLMFLNIGGIELLISVGFFYLGYRFSTGFNREFEYIVTDDFIDVDVIVNASRRKRLISFSLKETEIIAPVDSDEYKTYANKEFKVIDATTHKKDAAVYFAVVDKNGRKLVKFELPTAALTHLRKFAPSKVII